MSEIWKIEPLVGIGPIRLGMSRSEIAEMSSLLGEVYAYDEEKLPTGDVVFKEFRDLEAPFLTFKDGIVIDISIDHHTHFDIRFKNLKLFDARSETVLSAFQAVENGALFGLGMVLFPKLSVSTKNFLLRVQPDGRKIFWEDDSEKPPRVLTIAMSNAYDEFLPRYEAIAIE